jgi:Uma2 family endonuclease
MTTAEYLMTPETVQPAELAYGVYRVADSPVVRHQRVVRDLTITLTAFTKERRLGEVLPAPMDVVLDRERHLVVQPDVLFVAANRDGIVSDHIEGAPDLVIEVLSPRPRIGQVAEKVTWYGRYGVRECWLVDLDHRQIAILTFEDGRVAGRASFGSQEPIRSGVLPELALRPAEVLGWW